jgi:hypothetical protein
MEDIIDIIVTETTNTIEITAQPNDEIIDVNIIDNREDVTLNVTPTVVEININSLTGNFGVEWGDITGTLADQEDLQDALDLKADLVDGKVPSSQLPSYVDDVVEVATFSALPATGEIGKIYVILDTNKIYRWSGSVYVEIADSTAVWGAITGTLSSQTDLQSALDAKLSVTTAASTYVPYTGATANVNLGTRDLTADAIYVTNMTAGDGAIFAGGTLLTIANWNPDGRIAFRVDAGEVAVIINKDKTVSFYSAISATNGTFTEVLTGTSAVFNAITADYGISLTNIHDSSQGLLVRATDNDADLFLLRLQSSNGATSETWVDRFTVSKSGVATFSNSVTANSFIKSGGTSSQFLKADGSIDSSTYLTTSSASSTYVPYTGATANVDLGTHTLLAAKGTFSSSGSADTVGITHSSGSGIALNITKGGNGEGIYVNKSSGSGNAVTIVGSLNATTLVKNGGTSSQFLKADGSVDSNTYLTTGTASSTYLPLAGGTMTGAIVGTTASFAMSGSGIALEATGSGTGDAIRITHSSGRALTLNSSGTGFGILINNDTASTSAPFTIQKQGLAVITLTDAGAGSFASSLTANSFIKTSGTSSQFLKADGSVDSTAYQAALTNPVTGTGTSNRIAKFNGTSTITDSIIYDNGTRVSIGADVTTTNRLTVSHSTSGSYAISAQASSGAHGIWSVVGATGEIFRGQSSGGAYFFVDNSGNTSVSGQLNVGGFGTTGFKVNIDGTTNITGALSGTSATFSGNFGIGTASPSVYANLNTLTINGTNGSVIDFKTGEVLYGELYSLANEMRVDAVGASGTLKLLTNSVPRLTIASTGAATFSSSVTAGTIKSTLDQSTNNQFINISGTQSGNVQEYSLGIATSTKNFRIFDLTNSTTRLTITDAGNVLINKTSSNGNILQVQGDSYFDGQITAVQSNGLVRTSNADNAGMLHIRPNAGQSGYINWTENAVDDRWSIGVTGGDSNFYFRRYYPTSTPQMTITGGGDVLVGTTSDTFFNGSALGVGFFGTNGFIAASRTGGPSAIFNRYTSTGDLVIFRYAGTSVGSVSVTGSLTSYNVTSDYRLKQDFKSVNGLDIVNKIKVYDYEWKSDKTRMDGVLAHELAEVLPYAVTGVKDGEQMQSVDYSKIVPVMVQAIKELKAELDTLKNK